LPVCNRRYAGPPARAEVAEPASLKSLLGCRKLACLAPKAQLMRSRPVRACGDESSAIHAAQITQRSDAVGDRIGGDPPPSGTAQALPKAGETDAAMRARTTASCSRSEWSLTLLGVVRRRAQPGW
jgi:hypothetical protein